jgi:hypothetical protein
MRLTNAGRGETAAMAGVVTLGLVAGLASTLFAEDHIVVSASKAPTVDLAKVAEVIQIDTYATDTSQYNDVPASVSDIADQIGPRDTPPAPPTRPTNPIVDRMSHAALGGSAGSALTGAQSFCVTSDPSAGFEPPCDATLGGTGYIGGGGSGAPQNCSWHTSTSAEPGYSWPRVQTTNPLSGLQHLRFEYDAAQPTGLPDQAADPGSRNWAFSDDIVVASPGQQVLTLYVRANQPSAGGNAIIIQPQAPSQALLTTVMHLAPGGTILVGDDDSPGDDTFVILDTLFAWSPDGLYHKIEISINWVADEDPANYIRYFYDDALVWSTNISEGGFGGGVFAGSAFEHVLVRYEGNANEGFIVDVDDVCIEDGLGSEPTGSCCFNDYTECNEGLTPTECDGLEGIFLGIGVSCEACIAPLCAVTGSTNCQPVNTQNALTSTPGAFQVVDNFEPATGGDINSVCWYGAYGDETLPGLLDQFVVTIYECVEGLPGDPIASRSQAAGEISILKQDIGLDFAGVVTAFEYVATLDTPIAVSGGTTYFLEITNEPTDTGGGDPTIWFWGLALNTDPADNYSIQKPDFFDTYERYLRGDDDLAFCLDLDLVTPAACPLPGPAPCELDTSVATVTEGEPCGADPDLNLGCSADPPELMTIVLPSTDPANPTLMHGMAWADDNTRDVDWYQIDIDFDIQDADINGDGEVYLCLALASEIPMQAIAALEPSLGQCDADLAALDTVGFDCGASLAVGYPIAVDALFLRVVIVVRTADGAEIFNGFPCDSEPCLGDINQEGSSAGVVDFQDLLLVLAAWSPDPGSCPGCPEDLDGDDDVDFQDLLLLLAAWGPCDPTFGHDYLLEMSIADTFEECFPDPGP